MKPDIRWQLLLAVVCIGLILSIIGFQYQTSGICSITLPASGGHLNEGIIGQPSYINPIFSENNRIDQELVDLIFDGLTRYDASGQLAPALAADWEVSEDRRRITFELRDDVFWHDGEPFTADDVVFTYGLLQNDELQAKPELEALWQGVGIRQIDPYAIEFELPEPYGPFLEATTVPIIPAHILREESIEDLSKHRFNQRPVGTGPFMVAQGIDWRRTGYLRLVPNPAYWREGTMLDTVDLYFFADTSELIDAFRSGDIHAITRISESISEYANLPGIMLFTHPESRFTELIFNLSEGGSPALRQLGVRQALVHGLDRERLIDEAMEGQGLSFNGPYLPSNWAYDPAAIRDREYDAILAAEKLDAAGWVPDSVTGLRWSEDQPLEIRLAYLHGGGGRAVASDIKDQWAELGINVVLEPMEFDDYQEKLENHLFDVAIVDIEPPGDPDLYDFWSQEAIIRGQNYGGWNNRWASEALEAARQSFDSSERKTYYKNFLKYYDEDIPALTLFQHVSSYGISETVEEVEIGQINSPRERFRSMANWFFFYREVAVACSPEEL